MAGTRSIELRLFMARAWWLLWAVMLLQHRSVVDCLAAVAPPATLHTIQSPDGDIVDCVLIHHQPALQHPLLNNHTIQELPSFIPVDGHTIDKTQDHKISQVWHQNERCPFGTIPILRNDPSQFVHKKYPHQFPRTSNNISRRSLVDASISNHEYATAKYQPKNSYVYGASVILNLWNPLVELDNEFSLSQMWIAAGQYEGTDLNTIEIGWQVYPNLYHDRATRLFIYWTADHYHNTGCYNHGCSGFVQVDNTIAFGGSFQVDSTYKGDQMELPQILVWQDPQTKNWWLRYGTKSLGYWPKEIFTHLADHGERVTWGGEVINIASGGSHTSTQMGSGHFANEGYQGACYARSFTIVDSTNQQYNISIQDMRTLTTNPSCYNIELKSFTNWGASFFFGGPGKNPKCP